MSPNTVDFRLQIPGPGRVSSSQKQSRPSMYCGGEASVPPCCISHGAFKSP